MKYKDGKREQLSRVLKQVKDHLPASLFSEIKKLLNSDSDPESPQHEKNEPFVKAILDIEKTYPNPLKSMKKDFWLPTLLEYVPPHTVYVEPFSRSGNLFFSKSLAKESVISGINSDILDFYQYLKKASKKDFQWLRDQEWDSSENLLQSLIKKDAKPLREKIYKFKYLNLYSCKDGETGISKSNNEISLKLFLSNLEKFQKNLKSASISLEDPIHVMQEYDSPNTFFYLDPPHESTDSKEVLKNFSQKDFVEAVNELQGKILISYPEELDLSPRFKGESYTKGRCGTTAPSGQTLYYNFRQDEDRQGLDVKLALAAIGLEADQIDDSQDSNNSNEEVYKEYFHFSPIKKVEGMDEDALWKWAEQRMPIQIEPLFDGPRVSLGKMSGELIVDGLSEDEALGTLSKLTDLLFTVEQDFMLDGFVVGPVMTQGESLKEPPLDNQAPIFMVSDILFLDKDLDDKSLSQRRDLLKNFYSAYLLESSQCKLVPTKEAQDLEQLTSALKWSQDKPLSTGSIIKSTSSLVGEEWLAYLKEEKSKDDGEHTDSSLSKSEDGDPPKGEGCDPPNEEGSDLCVSIRKIDKDKQIAYGVVLEPDTEDAQGDKISAQDIEAAYIGYMKNSQTIGLNHERVAKDAKIIEATIIRSDQNIFGEKVTKGSWWLGLWVPDHLWPDVKSQKITGLSIGGTGLRTSIK